jgi:hypothetical protein
MPGSPRITADFLLTHSSDINSSLFPGEGRTPFGCSLSAHNNLVASCDESGLIIFMLSRVQSVCRLKNK